MSHKEIYEDINNGKVSNVAPIVNKELHKLLTAIEDGKISRIVIKSVSIEERESKSSELAVIGIPSGFCTVRHDLDEMVVLTCYGRILDALSCWSQDAANKYVILTCNLFGGSGSMATFDILIEFAYKKSVPIPVVLDTNHYCVLLLYY